MKKSGNRFPRNPTQARQIDIPVTLSDSEQQPEKGGSKIRTPRQEVAKAVL
jgi:hypothetical protein